MLGDDVDGAIFVGSTRCGPQLDEERARAIRIQCPHLRVSRGTACCTPLEGEGQPIICIADDVRDGATVALTVEKTDHQVATDEGVLAFDETVEAVEAVSGCAGGIHGDSPVWAGVMRVFS